VVSTLSLLNFVVVTTTDAGEPVYNKRLVSSHNDGDELSFYTSRYTRRLVLLANVNSRSRSLYAIARPSVACLPVVCNAHAPYSPVEIFGNKLMSSGTLAIY